jgi:hypothetical protein
MKTLLKTLFLLIGLMASSAFANYEITESWSQDLRSQIKISCSQYTNVCKELCGEAKSCLLKNSTCKDCISTGIKMNYLFTSFGKELVGKDHEVSIYEFVDFLKEGSFIGFSAQNIYNQFDSVQSDALAEKFKLMCPNRYLSPMAFFEIKNRVLSIENARYISCGSTILKLEVDTSMLGE